MERNRIVPRLRPRPYDLRRKVLLKNFFREQMTNIPVGRTTIEVPLDVNNVSDSDENDANTNTNEGNILTPKVVQDNIATPIPVPEPVPSTSNCSEKENSNNPENSSADETKSDMSEVEETITSKLSRLTRVFQKFDSRLPKMKRQKKGIIKPKHGLRSSQGILKPAGRKIIKDTESSTKGMTRSFFERFKSRRDKKRSKFASSTIGNLFGSRNQSPSKCDSKVATTSTQSVQTDMTWSPDHYEKMEQSHRSLLEENRLLSESLSSIITNADYQSTSSRNSCVTDSYTSSSDNTEPYFSREQRSASKSVGTRNHSEPAESSSSRTRILRSKSMQNRSEKRNAVSSRLRTRSFNCRCVNRPFNAESFRCEPGYCQRELYRATPVSNPVASRAKTRPSVLRSIEASPLYNKNASSLLQTFPGKPGKAITRRSSMPERTYNWSASARPVRSSSLRENNRYSYTSQRVSPRPKKPSPRRRSTTFNGYSCPVPFQDLPPEAFY